MCSFLLGQSAVAEIVVTRGERDTHFRLPDRQASRRVMSSLLVVLLSLGAYAIFLVITGTLRFAEDEPHYIIMSLCVLCILLAMIAAWRVMQVSWHYELTLTQDELAVLYVSSGYSWRTVRINPAEIVRFTLGIDLGMSWLQAEIDGESPRLLVREPDGRQLERLADFLTDACERLCPEWRVARAEARRSVNNGEPASQAIQDLAQNAKETRISAE